MTQRPVRSLLAVGEPAPWFHARALSGRDRFAFDTAAGRWVVLLLAGSVGPPAQRKAVALAASHRTLFDDKQAAFFAVTIDPSDESSGRIAQHLPGVRWFLDYDRAVSTLYGAASGESGAGTYEPHWLLLNPMLRVHECAPLGEGERIFEELKRRLQAPVESVGAPVLVVPQVLPPMMCQTLVNCYEANGGRPTGSMSDDGGLTTHKVDSAFKRRSDYEIEDEALIATLKAHVTRTLCPLIERAFQFEATRVERWLVACYDGAEKGMFRPHRDNTTKATAHRKFACTINLNAEEYDGGDLRFPEFGNRDYRAPTGGAVVFSCSLLHEARPVTRGRRYALLPFFYDDAGARVRERNLAFVDPSLRSYISGLPPEVRQSG
ncbi:MAG: 2OG-Fe(II) oxygenase [Sphingomonas bacterium]|nr:2OG-Fe(II) oxygenase [Sphingomonas bacterium]